MSVVLAIEEAGPCRRKLRIEVPQPAVEAETARVVQEYGRRAKIPGFRKGRVPTAMVRRYFGSEIDRDVLERLIPRYFRQAAAEKSLDPLGSPSVEEVDLREGSPLTFTALVEVRPEIELRNYRDFAQPPRDAEPTRQEIDDAIADLRRRHAEWQKVDRAAAVGDRVKAEVREERDGAEPQTAAFEIGHPGVWEEVSTAATGLAAGQSASFVRREGEGEEVRETRYQLRVEEVLEPRLPELDDEFARHFGEFADFAAFEADVVRRLGQAKQDEARRAAEQAMLDQLVERHPFPLPEGVVHAEIEDLLREYAENLARRGVDLEKAEIDWQGMGEQARPSAERRVRARLLLDAIADVEQIAVGPEETEQALAVLARLQGVATQALRQRLDESGELPGLRARMRREKTVRFLLGEGPGGQPESAPAAAVEPETEG